MGVSGMDAGSPVWHPGEAHLARANLTAFMARHGLAGFDHLMQKSTQDVAWFTESILEYLSIQFETPYTQVLDLERGLALPRWCVGGRMNIVESCLDSQIARGRGPERALVWESEAGETRDLTYLELQKQVDLAASAFLSLGLRKGEVIGIYMPMITEIAIAVLAIARIGAIVLPLFSGYGPEALATRLEDAGAVALVTVDGHARRGVPIRMKGVADKAASRLPALRRMIVVKASGQDVPMQSGRDLWWHELMTRPPLWSPLPTPPPKMCLCSSTPPARLAGQRGPSIRIAASR